MQPAVPFPEDLPTYPLKRLSLSKLLADDEEETKRLFEACQRDGFFLLDLKGSEEQKGILSGVDTAFDIAERYFGQSEDEKLKHMLNERAIGYKPLGLLKGKQKSEVGQSDQIEMFTIDIAKLHEDGGKDLPKVMQERFQQLDEVAANLQDLGKQILQAIAKSLHIPPSLIESFHSRDGSSKTSLRLLHGPPQLVESQRRWSFPGHQDHGSLTILFNRLGGLQVLNPDADGVVSEDAWLWVKPEPDCAIINLGNPFVRWTGGVMRSAFHRVLYPPGEQIRYDRYSFGLFIKPKDDASLQRLKGSDLIPKMTPEEEELEKDVPTFGNFHKQSINYLTSQDAAVKA